MYAIKNKQLTASGQVTTKVAAGTNTLSAPARVLQLSIRCGSTLGRVDLIDNGAGGTVKYTVPTPAIGAGEDEVMTISFPDFVERKYFLVLGGCLSLFLAMTKHKVLQHV